MPQVAPEVVKERARRLRGKGDAAFARHLAAQVGARRRVLTVSQHRGHTEQFAPVRLAGAVAASVILDLKITGHDDRALLVA